jgi:hypothetical protein
VSQIETARRAHEIADYERIASMTGRGVEREMDRSVARARRLG